MPHSTTIRRSIIIAVLALAHSFAGAAQRDGPQGTLRFVAVGVSRYPALPLPQQLNFAHKDAEDFARLWHDQRGKLYRQVEGTSLLNEQATLANTLAALDDLIARGQAGDMAVISLCGHAGECGVRGEWGFLPSDFDPVDSARTSLTCTVLRTRLATLARRGVTVILILDCCHAGAFGAQDADFVVFAACLPQEFSRENFECRNGLYTRALIEALQGKADFNGDGLVSLAEVDAYVTSRLEQLLRGEAGQNPSCGRPTSIRGSLPLARIVLRHHAGWPLRAVTQ